MFRLKTVFEKHGVPVNTARRRADRRRMVRRAMKLYEGCDVPQMYADRLAACSCAMCGNPRKHFRKRSRGEKAADLTLAETVL